MAIAYVFQISPKCMRLAEPYLHPESWQSGLLANVDYSFPTFSNKMGEKQKLRGSEFQYLLNHMQPWLGTAVL